MQIAVELTRDALEARAFPAPDARTGALVEFRGLVRGEEDGAPIAALDYEAYQPMAERTLHRIAAELGALHPCETVHIVHRIGTVPVGAAAIVLRVAARHRAEAFAFVSAFMDRLKQDVPIWKIRALPTLAPAAGAAQP